MSVTANQVTRNLNGSLFNLTYNAENRLVAATQSPTHRMI